MLVVTITGRGGDNPKYTIGEVKEDHSEHSKLKENVTVG